MKHAISRVSFASIVVLELKLLSKMQAWITIFAIYSNLDSDSIQIGFTIGYWKIHNFSTITKQSWNNLKFQSVFSLQS